MPTDPLALAAIVISSMALGTILGIAIAVGVIHFYENRRTRGRRG